MVPTHDLPRLTPTELEVMKVLWGVGKLSAREVHEQLAERLRWAYSTTRTTMDRLVAKGLLTKQAFHGLHLYAPAISRAAGLAPLVRDFARQVLESSPAPVVSLVAESSALSAEEIAELRALIDEEEG
jgi:predicted transcriptional regulator